jgi:uncharacterized protein (DUF2249 family)
MTESFTTLPVATTSAGCNCSDTGAHSDPVLDARTIPHRIRHGAIFGALDSLNGGEAMVLVAPHDPLPLLAQARSRYPEGLEVEYLQSGPDAWHLRLAR